MSNKSQKRRGYKHRKQQTYDTSVFASPEAAKVAEQASLGLVFGAGEALYGVDPTGSGGLWRVGDVRKAIAAFALPTEVEEDQLIEAGDYKFQDQPALQAALEAADEFGMLAAGTFLTEAEELGFVPIRGDVWDVADVLHATDMVRKKRMSPIHVPAPEEISVPPTAEEVPAAEPVVEAPEIIEVTPLAPEPEEESEYVKQGRREAAEALAELGIGVEKPTWQGRIHSFFSGIRIPKVRMPGLKTKAVEAGQRLESWLEGDRTAKTQVPRALATGLVVGLIGVLLIVAGSLIHPQSLLRLALFPPAGPVELTPVVEAVAVVVTPVTPTAVATKEPAAKPTEVPTEEPVEELELEVEPEAKVETEVEAKAEAEEVAVGSISDHIANAAEGTEVHLIDGTGDMVALTTTDANGNYKFENVLVGEYTLHVAGMVTASSVQVTEGEEVTASALHQVEKGESLWKIFGARTWKTFTDFADAHGLKHHVDDRGTEDTADDLLVVIIQPGQVFDLAAMPSG